MSGLFEDRSKEAYDRAIANIEAEASGAGKASKSDVEMAERAARQAGSVGNRARRALNSKSK